MSSKKRACSQGIQQLLTLWLLNAYRKYCNKILAGQGNLNKHVATVHEGARPFGCHVCGRDFTTKQHRDIHVKKTHEATAVKQETL